ncbi:MAG TPA: prolyl oligopeptidase family serine peptidase, partial [Thermoanaerobaculia bacterium]
NTTEFGSPDDPQQLRAMMAYSPYHHVVDGTPYPAVLLLTGDNDGRVDPMNSRKFTARLQAATGSSRPILLRTTSSAGHGIGTALSEAVAAQTDAFAFLWRELGMPQLR